MITSPSVWGSIKDCADNGVFDCAGSGAPVNGASGTGVGICGQGSFYYDTLNKVLYEQVNTITNPVWIPWSLNDNTSTTSGTVQSTEYTLNSITIPANYFQNARGVVIEAWGTLAANGNAKNLKLYLGGTALITATTTASGVDYTVYGTVIRTANNAQSANANASVGSTPTFTMAVTAPTETDTSNIIIALKTSNTAASAASGTGKGLTAGLLF